MTKNQALSLMSALEAQLMPASAVLSFATDGTESWAVALDTTHIYTGTQIGHLATYCEANNLTLSAQFVALGIT